MKQVIGNRYLKVFSFCSSDESSIFFHNQKVVCSLSLDSTFGENHYCYVCYHSLTKEKLFVLSFSSDKREDDLNFFFWDNLLVLDVGTSIYLLDKNLSIIASYETSICLIGLYLINNDRLLILEEASFKVINQIGQIIMNVSLDLIEDFSINGSLLTIQTNGENRVIELT
jgi:hypothetical protein